MSVESNIAIALILHCFICDWPKNVAPLSQPIRSKAKTNGNLHAHVFPGLLPAMYLLRVMIGLFVPVVIGQSNYFGLWLYDTPLKTALLIPL